MQQPGSLERDNRERLQTIQDAIIPRAGIGTVWVQGLREEEIETGCPRSSQRETSPVVSAVSIQSPKPCLLKAR